MTQDKAIGDGRRRGSSPHQDAPPPRAEVMPSLKNFNIPKRNKKRDLLTEVKLDSREAKDIIKNIADSFWEPDAYTLEFNSIKLVYNEMLEKQFTEKRQEMKEHPRADVSESYAFLRLKNPTQTGKVCQQGLHTATQRFYLPPSRASCIGDEKYGVYLSRCADILSRRTTLDHIADCTLVVFKYMKGRLKAVASQGKDSSFEPTIDYDGHTSIHFQLGRKLSLEKTYDYSQIYLYEVNLDNMANGDDSMYAKRPRHCVPHAIVQFKTKRKQAQAKIQPVSVPVTQPSIGTTSTASTDSGTDTFRYEDFQPKIKYAWQGYYFNHKRFLSEIQLGIFSTEKNICPIDGGKEKNVLTVKAFKEDENICNVYNSVVSKHQNICVTQKISWEKLSSLLPTKLFRKPPCVSMKASGFDDRKSLPYLHAELHATANPGRFVTMEKLIQRWIKTKSAGVCTFSSGTKLFLIPTGELTEKLGITCEGYPPIMHCIFRKYHTDTNEPKSTDYGSFIKNQKQFLRVRLAQIEEMKNVQSMSHDAYRHPNAFNRFDSEKLISCLDAMRRAYAKSMKRIANESQGKTMANGDNLEDSDDDALTVNINEIENETCCEDPSCSHDHVKKKPADTYSRLMTDIDVMEDPMDNDVMYNDDSTIELLEESPMIDKHPEIPFLGNKTESQNTDSSGQVAVTEKGHAASSHNHLTFTNGGGSHDEFSDISEVMNTGPCFEDISEEENATRSNAGAHVLPGKKPLEDELQSIVKLREEMRKQCTNNEFVTDTISNTTIFQDMSSSDSLSEIASSISAARERKRRKKDLPRAYRTPSPDDQASTSSREGMVSSRRYEDPYRDPHNENSRSWRRSRSRSRSHSQRRSRHRHRSSRSRSSSSEFSPHRKSRKRSRSHSRNEEGEYLDKRQLYGSPSNVFTLSVARDAAKNKQSAEQVSSSHLPSESLVIEIPDDDENGREIEQISNKEPGESNRDYQLPPPPPPPVINIPVSKPTQPTSNKTSSDHITQVTKLQTRLKLLQDMEEQHKKSKESHLSITEQEKKEQRRKRSKVMISPNGLMTTGCRISPPGDSGAQEWIKRAKNRCSESHDLIVKSSRENSKSLSEEVTDEERNSGPEEWVKRAENLVKQKTKSSRKNFSKAPVPDSEANECPEATNDSSGGLSGPEEWLERAERRIKGIPDLLERVVTKKMKAILGETNSKSKTDATDDDISFVVESSNEDRESGEVQDVRSVWEKSKTVDTNIAVNHTLQETSLVKTIDKNTTPCETKKQLKVETSTVSSLKTSQTQQPDTQSHQPRTQSLESRAESPIPQDMDISPVRSDNQLFFVNDTITSSNICDLKNSHSESTWETVGKVINRKTSLVSWASLIKHEELDGMCANIIEDMRKAII